uniref:SJCHGC05910 protein n=1 Tax=Schistosoma japonicum TaxID=6182 RepID=Q5DB93_SCHJA|nr:SJCHGC05910 protein [Schistosoma japonicum]
MQSGHPKHENSIDLEYFLSENESKKTVEKCPPDIFFSLETNPITDGSAYLEMGEIKVACSVNGPTEMRQDSQLVTMLKFAPFLSWLPKDIQASMERKLSRLLLTAIEPAIMLHHFPRGKYEIVTNILDIPAHNSAGLIGDCLAAAITCAGLALLNSGVQMYDLLVGLNLDLADLGSENGHLCVAVLPRLRQFSMLYTVDSHMPNTEYLKHSLTHAMENCIKLTDVIRSHLCGQLKNKINM